MPVPFPLATVNAWLFPGDQPALVDCGIGTDEAYQQLLRGIGDAGIDAADLRLYITHGHVDHAGNARRLRDDHDVPLFAPDEERPFVETFRRDGTRRNDEFAMALRANGMPPDRIDKIRQDSDAIDVYLDDVTIYGDVDHGERVILGDIEAETILTPGHTPGSVCFLLTEDNDLVTGDTLLETITSNAVELRDADHGNYHAYVQSIESLRRYVGVDCLPGHRRVFRMTDDIIDHHLDMHEKRRRAILDALDQPRTAFEVLPRIFPKGRGTAFHFMGMAEIVGHLHAAEKDGLVERVEVDGVRQYRRL